MSKILENKNLYSIFYFIFPIMILLYVAFLNFSTSFSLNKLQVSFFFLIIVSVPLSIYFICEFLEKNFIINSSTSLIGAFSFISTFCYVLNNDFIIKSGEYFITVETISSFLLLFLNFISNLINSFFTVFLGISLIIFLSEFLFSGVFSFILSEKVSFVFVREISIIFIITFLFKSITQMLIECGGVG